jgi:transposase InsO family protein
VGSREKKGINKMKQEGSNKIKQQYLVANRNYAFCSDITQLARNSHYIAYIIDLGSRLVIAHIITEQITNAGDLTLLLKQGLANRQLTGATIFHSDLGSQYTSSEFRDFAIKQGLQISTAARASHENQVAERFNRTLKGLIRKRLLAEPGSPSPKSSTDRLVMEVTFEHLSKVVNACVEEYNSKPHGGYSMYKASPFDMDEALSNRKSVLEVAKDDNSKEALSIRHFRAADVKKYAGDWESFFLDWRAETQRQAEKQAEATRALYEQNRRLEEQNRQLQEKVDYLVQDVQQKKEEQEAQLTLKLKRKLATKLPLSD